MVKLLIAKNWMPAPGLQGGKLIITWVPLLLTVTKLSKPVLCNILLCFMTLIVKLFIKLHNLNWHEFNTKFCKL